MAMSKQLIQHLTHLMGLAEDPFGERSSSTDEAVDPVQLKQKLYAALDPIVNHIIEEYAGRVESKKLEMKKRLAKINASLKKLASERQSLLSCLGAKRSAPSSSSSSSDLSSSSGEPNKRMKTTPMENNDGDKLLSTQDRDTQDNKESNDARSDDNEEKKQNLLESEAESHALTIDEDSNLTNSTDSEQDELDVACDEKYATGETLTSLFSSFVPSQAALKLPTGETLIKPRSFARYLIGYLEDQLQIPCYSASWSTLGKRCRELTHGSFCHIYFTKGSHVVTMSFTNNLETYNKTKASRYGYQANENDVDCLGELLAGERKKEAKRLSLHWALVEVGCESIEERAEQIGRYLNSFVTGSTGCSVLTFTKALYWQPVPCHIKEDCVLAQIATKINQANQLPTTVLRCDMFGREMATFPLV